MAPDIYPDDWTVESLSKAEIERIDRAGGEAGTGQQYLINRSTQYRPLASAMTLEGAVALLQVFYDTAWAHCNAHNGSPIEKTSLAGQHDNYRFTLTAQPGRSHG